MLRDVNVTEVDDVEEDKDKNIDQIANKRAARVLFSTEKNLFWWNTFLEGQHIW